MFQTTRNNITLHIRNIFKEGELEESSVCKESLLTAADGKRYKTKFYSLDVIISVGYRVKSIRGTQFRIWANKILKDYLLRGYSVNQRLLYMENRIDRRLLEHDKRLDFSQFPKELAEAFAKAFKDGLDKNVKNALHDGIRNEFTNQITGLNESAKRLTDRMYSIVNGAIWTAIPKWVYIVFAIAVLAAGGFGYGFFHQLKENSKLKDVEWLYRYERLWWEGKQQEDLLRREKTFAVGTQPERDSIKNHTRQLEKSRHIEETFLYFNPTEK